MAQTATNETGHGVSAIRGNGFDKAMVQSFVDRMLDIHGQIASATSEHMNNCKSLRGDLKTVVDEASEAGIKKRALKGAVKKKLLEKKIEDIRDNMESDDIDDYDKVLQALGDFGDTPLGQSALSNVRHISEAPSAEVGSSATA